MCVCVCVCVCGGGRRDGEAKLVGWGGGRKEGGGGLWVYAYKTLSPLYNVLDYCSFPSAFCPSTAGTNASLTDTHVTCSSWRHRE